MIIEADKSQELQGESAGRPRRADVSIQVQRQEKMDMPAGRQPGMRDSLLFQGKSALQLIGRGRPTLGKAACFTRSVDLNVNLMQKHPGRHAQNNV